MAASTDGSLLSGAAAAFLRRRDPHSALRTLAVVLAASPLAAQCGLPPPERPLCSAEEGADAALAIAKLFIKYTRLAEETVTLLERLAVADVAPSVRTQALLLLKELYVKRADLGNGLRALNAAVEIAGAGEDRELLHVLLVDAVWQCASLGFHGLAARYCGAAKEWLRAVGSSAAMVGVFTAAEMQLKVFEGKGLDGMEALAKELRLIVGNEKQMLAKRDILLSERECRVKEAFLSYAESVQRMMAER